MREIKFRCWDVERKKMEPVGAIDWASDGLPITVNTESVKIYRMNHDEQFVLMQYTGLNDKNGREIYEGDILRFDDKPSAYEVAWSMGGFHAMPTDKPFDSSAERWVGVGHTSCEVTGNIYEN